VLVEGRIETTNLQEKFRFLLSVGFPGPNTTVRAASTTVRDGRAGDTCWEEHPALINGYINEYPPSTTMV
jgi:hypothetical protein